MPLAPVDQHGTHLYYEDSGPPTSTSSTTYVTLVVIHGGVFHGAGFRPMFQFAVEHNLRLICVNLRDYPGSTPYTPTDLDIIHSGDHDAQADLIKARGLEIGAFLTWIIENADIPPISTLPGDHVSGGGLAVTAWSAGNCVMFAFLAYANLLSEHDQELLRAYLRSYIIYDSAFYAMGCPFPTLTEISSPLRDDSVPPSELGQKFSHWVSSYFHHNALHSNLFYNLTRLELLSRFSQTPPTSIPVDEQPTIECMSPETFAAVADVKGVPRSHIPLVSNVDPKVYAKNLRAALVQRTLPDVRLELIWCERSPADTAYASWYLADTVKRMGDARRVRMWTFEGANHFAHWDKPEETVKFFARIV